MTKSIEGEQVELDRLVSVYTEDMLWEKAKENGSDHYKTGSVEPIDLYRAAAAFIPFALSSIIKYAFRLLTRWRTGEPMNPKDLDKIIDYAQKIKAHQGVA